MEKKLYRVKVILYVMAENESDARMTATNAAFDIFECTARKVDVIDPGWEEAIPYNSDDSRTCAEVVADQKIVSQRSVPFQFDTHLDRLGTQASSMAAVQ
jgi:hypothetical protein